ncbi:MAG: fibronectin type III domain-containing protein [Ignavibacteriae bacterium]|nr:fibronectin type III domain-containing protein [Ignavibacteriota bacterium]
MKHEIHRTLLPALLLALICAACSDSGTAPSDAPLAGPSNLRAWSADSTIGLRWNGSSSEWQTNFDKYVLTVWDKYASSVTRYDVPKGTTTMLLRALHNGHRYQISLHAFSTAGNRSADSAVVEWAPSPRVTRDVAGAPIRVYTSASALPSGVDLFVDSARAEVLQVTSAAFAARGDFFVYSPLVSGIVEITSPHLAANPGQRTEFSTSPYVEAASLDDSPATSSPASSTYTASSIILDNAVSQKGRIYFGRLVRGTARYYFRLFIKRGSDDRLVQGFGTDRYIEVEASFQSEKNVPFSK